ncbi:hypothetical protein HpHA286_27510 [Helicobacter pylori]
MPSPKASVSVGNNTNNAIKTPTTTPNANNTLTTPKKTITKEELKQ